MGVGLRRRNSHFMPQVQDNGNTLCSAPTLVSVILGFRYFVLLLPYSSLGLLLNGDLY